MGRKSKRTDSSLILSYLEKKIPNVRQLSERRKESKSSSQRALSKSLKYFIRLNQGSWLKLIPKKGKLILIADAIWYWVAGEKYTIYVLLLRQQNSEEAMIWPPYLASGHECIDGWIEALERLPDSIQTRIGAIICDGGTGLINLAYRHKWLLQRCQFHLMASFQNYLTTGPRSQQLPLARKVFSLVKILTTDLDEKKAQKALNELLHIRAVSRSRGIRRVIGGLSLHWKDYRTYLDYPGWHLPKTSNTAESCIQCIRDLMYRCRGFRSPKQLMRWLTSFTIYKKKIFCRGNNQPN